MADVTRIRGVQFQLTAARRRLVAAVTYAGYAVAMNTFKDFIVQNMQSMPSDILQLLLIAGFGQGLGYIFGAFAFKIAMTTINKITMSLPAGGKS